MTILSLTKRSTIFFILILGILNVTSCSDNDPEDTTLRIKSYTSPEFAFVGNEITINGTNFGTTIEDVEVYFYSDAQAEILELTNKTILVTIPADAYAGPIRVKVKTLEAEGPSFDVMTWCWASGLQINLPCPRNPQ